jgi:hypothetical protein
MNDVGNIGPDVEGGKQICKWHNEDKITIGTIKATDEQIDKIATYISEQEENFKVQGAPIGDRRVQDHYIEARGALAYYKYCICFFYYKVALAADALLKKLTNNIADPADYESYYARLSALAKKAQDNHELYEKYSDLFKIKINCGDVRKAHMVKAKMVNKEDDSDSCKVNETYAIPKHVISKSTSTSTSTVKTPNVSFERDKQSEPDKSFERVKPVPFNKYTDYRKRKSLNILGE